MANIKFISSYSGGKDSALALYRAIRKGYTPAGIITTCDIENERSWFHNIPIDLLEKTAEALDIPVKTIYTGGEKYAFDFEATLKFFGESGVEYCVFGDIDIQGHFDWCDERCQNAGLKSFFPLWNENRKDLVTEFVNSGFKAVITVLNTEKMSREYLGQTLTLELIEKLEKDGTDVCGENGEYHTFVYDGPIFKKPVPFELGESSENHSYIRMPIKLKN